QLVSGSTPSGILRVQLWDDSGVGTPGNFIDELGTVDVSTFPLDPFAAGLFPFDTAVSGLTPNALYHIFLDLSALTVSVGPFGSPFLGALQSPAGTNGSPGLLINTTTFQQPPFAPGDWESQGALFGEAGERYLQMSITAQNVPLPNTLVLFGLGLAALRCARRR
nr:PEP-CTERM sorting domain-containing protein [Gammaproteobacteria bacterium]